MKIALIAATALSLLAAPAFAQSASSTVTLAGTVAKACGLGNHISGNTPNPAWIQGNISGIAMTDAEGKFNGFTSDQRSFGNMWCNTAANVSLTVTPFSTGNTSNDTGSFANSFAVKVTTDTSVYFNANTPGGIVQSTVSTNGSAAGPMPGAFETGTGRYSGLVIEILPAIGSGGNNKRPVAGDYAGSITLTATAS